MDTSAKLLTTVFVSLILGGVVYLQLRHRKLCEQGRLQRRLVDRLILLLVLVYSGVFVTLAVLKEYSFNGTGFDLAQYDQLIWNSLHGNLLQNTLLPDAPFFLGKSFAPILLALIPLYAVWADPNLLLVVTTVAVSVTAFPLYWQARKTLGVEVALALVCAYFLSPVVEYLNLAQFYEITLTTPLLGFALFLLLRHHYRGFLVCLALALLVKEEIAFVTIFIGLFVLVIQRRRSLGIGLTIFGIVWAVILLEVIIPALRGGEFGKSFYYFGRGGPIEASRYDYLGANLSEILTTVLTKPDVVLAHVWIPAKIEYVMHFLVPTAFLPLFGIEVAALAIPTFAYTLLSDFVYQYSIRHAYTAPLVPIIFFAAILGAQRIQRGFSMRNSPTDSERMARKWALGVIIVSASGLSYYWHAPGPLAVGFEPAVYALNPHISLAHSLFQRVPSDVTVVAQKEFVSHFSRRARIYEFPTIPDYRLAEYLVADTTRFWYEFHGEEWAKWLDSGYFERVVEQDGYLIFKRRAPVHPVGARFGDRITLAAYTMAPADSFTGGQTLRPIVEWRAEENVVTRYVVEVHLLDVQGHLWASDDREPVSGNVPTTEWTRGQSVQDQYALHLQHTMPSGNYRVVLRVVDSTTKQALGAHDESGKNSGDTFTLTTVSIEKSKANLTTGQVTIEERVQMDARELRLLGSTPLPKSISAGTMLSVGLYWRAMEKPRGDYVVGVQLRDAHGRIAVEEVNRPAMGTYPTTQWDAGEVLLDWHDLGIPPSLNKGAYALTVVVGDLTGGVTGEKEIATTVV